jgi:hypothetical protein
METLILSCLLAHFLVRLSSNPQDVELSDVTCEISSHRGHDQTWEKLFNGWPRYQGTAITITWTIFNPKERRRFLDAIGAEAVGENPRIFRTRRFNTTLKRAHQCRVKRGQFYHKNNVMTKGSVPPPDNKMGILMLE